MKRIISYIPSMSIAFSIGTLAVCLINILYSDPVNRFSVGLVQFAAYIVLTVLVDIIISSIDFHHYLAHFFAEVVFDYPILLAFIYFGKWDPFNFATHSHLHHIIFLRNSFHTSLRLLCYQKKCQ